MEFLQVYDIRNNMQEQNRPVDVPVSVKLPLLSLQANRATEHQTPTPHKELWEYRVEESRKNNSIPLLKAPDTISADYTPETVSSSDIIVFNTELCVKTQNTHKIVTTSVLL